MGEVRIDRERLIDEVKKCPVLYDTGHERHRDIDARDSCWADISQRLGADSEVLKREWKSLRDSLRQSLKKSRRGDTTKAGQPCKKWRYHSRMAFVLPYMTRREQRHHVSRDVKLRTEVSGGEGEESGGEAPGGGGGGGGGDASLELFFASVCSSARRLPRGARARLKRDVLDALLRAEDAAQVDTKPCDSF